MSSMKRRISRDTDQLRPDGLANRIPQRRFRHQIDAFPEQTLQEELGAEKRVRGNWRLERREQIDIAVRASFVSSHRAEQRKRAHAELVDFVAVQLQTTDDVLKTQRAAG